ncbi:MAG: PD-(D/E)XK nuclease family protein [Dehalococcoidia bacterium]|nr:PD-(D/E)XK nuclease family protein [Dehalococcoidia bacterium]
MAVPRSEPYIWVTWLSKLLVGEDSCEWAAWFKAQHGSFDKVPSSFNQAAWLMAHTSLLGQVRTDLEDKGLTVFTERQNNFTLKGKAATLGGQADLIGTSGGSGLILDAKTGQPRTSDHVQVMIYMWAIPQALRQYQGVVFDGKVVYTDHEVPIPASAVDDAFKTNLIKLIRQVSSASPLRKVPSRMECGFCPIARTECRDRIEGPDDREPGAAASDF